MKRQLLKNFLKRDKLEDKITILTKKIESLDNEIKAFQTMQKNYFECFNRELKSHKGKSE